MNVDDVAALPVAVGADGSPIPLSAIATVVEGAEDRLLRVSGPGGETVLVSVSRLPGASTPDVVARVQEAVRQATASFPAGVSVDARLRSGARSSTNRCARSATRSCSASRCASRSSRCFCAICAPASSPALAVPLTLGMTFVAARASLGQSLNLMSLGGLAVAIGLVDRRRDRRRRGDRAAGSRTAQAPADAARDGARELLAALVGTTLTTVVVFLPLALARRRRRTLLRRARDHALGGGADLARGRADGRPARRGRR